MDNSLTEPPPPTTLEQLEQLDAHRDEALWAEGILGRPIVIPEAYMIHRKHDQPEPGGEYSNDDDDDREEGEHQRANPNVPRGRQFPHRYNKGRIIGRGE